MSSSAFIFSIVRDYDHIKFKGLTTCIHFRYCFPTVEGIKYVNEL